MAIYLDNAATTRVSPEAADMAARVMLQEYGNPGSTHAKGRAARAILDAARRQVAAPLGCKPQEITFTSGGTESDNWAIRGAAQLQRRRGGHILSSRTEHDAVRQTLLHLERQGWEVTFLSPGPDGAVTPEAVAAALREDTALVTLMLVNNETGAITDIAGVSRVLKEAGSGALLHTDAVQAYGKLPFTSKGLGADLISLSGHKIHAPKGIGALYIREGVKLPPLLFGGGQENSLRSGTEPLPPIAAFGVAAQQARDALPEAMARMAENRAFCVETLCAALPEIVLIPGGAGHILSIALPGWRSEVLMNYLEREQIFVSKSSACKRGRRSHVLEAMGLPERVIDGALRVSFSRYTTREDIDALCDALRDAKQSLFPSLH